jgi:putative ABC transport system substrate-binding protein
MAAVMAAPCVAQAQDTRKPARVGVLLITTAAASVLLPDFRAALRDRGYVEGKTLFLEYGEAGGKVERLPELARRLVDAGVHVIYAPTGPAALAAKKVTSSVPIVFAGVPDPVGIGLVTNLGRPGGNVTGISFEATAAQAAKQLELLRELAPSATRIGFFRDPDLRQFFEAYQLIVAEARSKLGFELVQVDVRKQADLPRAFEMLERSQVDALWLAGQPIVFQNRAMIAEFAIQKRLPAVAGYRQFVDAGGLASFGASLTENHRRGAAYVDKILKGAAPSELPIEQPSKFELIINLKTARALGFTIPPSLLARADQVIE